jgi:tripartite-type tricarboxylate transporter receptor subunit TctC
VKRTLQVAIALVGLLVVPVPAPANEPAYPAKPIRLIVPSTPGSPPDVVARLVGVKLALAVGQPVVVENRPGATGLIGLQVVASAAPDGYTLGVMGMPHTVTPSLVAKMPYDTERDLVAVALINWNSHVLAVPAGSSIRSVADLVAAAKAKPGALRFSSGGNGTPAHLAGELLKREAGIDMTHVPYKSAPAAAQALLAAEVDAMVATQGSVAPHVTAGKLRPLATPAPRRLASYPDLPTFAELGYAVIQLRDWQGIVAPAGTPRDVIVRLDGELAKVIAMPDVKQRLEAVGMEVAGMGPEEFAAHIRRELRRWGQLTREAGIKAD